MSALEQYITRTKELEEQVAQLHKFLDELWGMYKLNETLRKRILAAKAARWETALMSITLTEADRQLIESESTAYANRNVTPGTEHAEQKVFEETGETFGI